MRVRMVAVAVAGFLLGGVAFAVPITYSFQGTGSGTIGATPFSGASFTITVTADTDGITAYAPGILYNPAITSTILIAGVGTATFTDAKQVLVAQPVSAVGFEQSGGFNLLDVHNSIFATYDLASPIAPAFDPAPTPVDQFSNIPTTLGALTFTSYQNTTFTTSAVGSAIPTLSPAGLAALGLLVLVAGAVLLRRIA